MKEKETMDDVLNDNTIVELYWERDERAIQETDKKYGKYLYAISYNILRNNLDSEECINDTYLSTWNRIPPTRPTMLQRFLSKITRDISVDKYRKTRAMHRVPSELTASLDELEECIEGTLIEQEIQMVSKISGILNVYLRGLSHRSRFIFICRYYYADPVQFIAKMLDLSVQTVYRELAKMRSELRKALAKEGIVI